MSQTPEAPAAAAAKQTNGTSSSSGPPETIPYARLSKAQSEIKALKKKLSEMESARTAEAEANQGQLEEMKDLLSDLTNTAAAERQARLDVERGATLTEMGISTPEVKDALLAAYTAAAAADPDLDFSTWAEQQKKHPLYAPHFQTAEQTPERAPSRPNTGRGYTPPTPGRQQYTDAEVDKMDGPTRRRHAPLIYKQLVAEGRIAPSKYAERLFGRGDGEN